MLQADWLTKRVSSICGHLYASRWRMYSQVGSRPLIRLCLTLVSFPEVCFLSHPCRHLNLWVSTHFNSISFYPYLVLRNRKTNSLPSWLVTQRGPFAYTVAPPMTFLVCGPLLPPKGLCSLYPLALVEATETINNPCSGFSVWNAVHGVCPGVIYKVIYHKGWFWSIKYTPHLKVFFLSDPFHRLIPLSWNISSLH